MQIGRALVGMMTFRLGFHEIMNDREYSRIAGKGSGGCYQVLDSTDTTDSGNRTRVDASHWKSGSFFVECRRIAVGTKRSESRYKNRMKDRRSRVGEVEGVLGRDQ